jgi:hypothetical protein
MQAARSSNISGLREVSVPTFENGWICRECWCANREQDGRCYRCHVERPVYGVMPETAQAPSEPARATLVVSEPIAPPPAIIKPQTAEPTADARPIGHYCLTCGRKMLDGASFCTQCGSRSPEAEPAVPTATAAHQHAENVAAALAKPKRPSLPRPDLRAALHRVRTGYLAFVARHALRWDLAMAALAVVFVAFGAAAERLDGSLAGLLLTAQWAITFLFGAEYGTRLAASADRRSFAIGHPMELIAVIPPVRALRVFALLRWLGLPEYGRRLSARFASLTDRARRNSRNLLAGLWVILVFLGVAMLYQYTGASPSGIDRLLAITAGVLVVCLVSAVTAVLTSSILIERRAADELARRARIIAELKDAGLLADGAAAMANSTDRVSPPPGRSVDSARPTSELSPQR